MDSGLVGNCHGHKVFVANGDGSVEVGISCSKRVRERSQHDATLYEIAKLQVLFCEAIEAHDDELTKLRGDSEAHVVVGGE